jgi:hypothetical protein
MFLGSIGSFLLFVPILSIATVVWAMLGLVLMFGLGVQVGSREMLLSETAGKKSGRW